jgi:hypothetical protein
MTLRPLVFVLVASSCAAPAARPSTESAAPAPSSPVAAATPAPSAAALPVEPPFTTPTPPSASPATSVASTDPVAVAPPAASTAGVGHDFIAEAMALYRVAACGSKGDVPARLDAAIVRAHCDELTHAYAEYERTWVDVAEPFIAALRPADLPRVVVYPFGGGDLAGALATFPDASEITTISLEPAGDPRPIDTLTTDRLARELGEHRAHLERLFEKAHSRTDNLDKEAHTELPGEIVFALAALVVHRREPVALRYFRLSPDGAIDYVTQADIAGAKSVADRRALFTNAELSFRAIGVPSAPVQVLRHIGYNLDDAHLAGDKSLLAHLDRKGKVAAMTKAASHLLWSDHFSIIRGWLVAHTDWMISDSTGIPPRIAAPAHFAQDAYGTFAGPAGFGLIDARDAADVRHLFDTQPHRDLPFRYGYPDGNGRSHLLVTRRVQGEAADAGAAHD